MCVCVCINAYVHVYLYVCVYAYTLTQILTCIHTRMYIPCTCMNACHTPVVALTWSRMFSLTALPKKPFFFGDFGLPVGLLEGLDI